MLGLPDRPEARVGTVEHVLAALAGCGVHNAVLEVDGPEMPILDGSSDDFVFLIDCAGIVEQNAPVDAIEVLRPVRVSQGESYRRLRPGARVRHVGVDRLRRRGDRPPGADAAAGPAVFRRRLARARTFTLAYEVETARRRAGAGGSLDNAVVVDGAAVLNPAGLRMPDEFVRHKLLDAVGDLALAGALLHGRSSPTGPAMR